MVLAEIQSLAARGRIRGEPAADIQAVARVEPVLTADALLGGRLHGQMRSRGKPKASLADALILATARRVGTRVLTLDKDLSDEGDVELLA